MATVTWSLAARDYNGSSGVDQGQISIFYGPLTNYSGSNNIWLADAHIQGVSQGDYFGATSTWVEDLGGGGTLDIVIGAPNARGARTTVRCG